MTPTFPEVYLLESDFGITLQTRVRILHEGKFYLSTIIMERVSTDESVPVNKAHFWKAFIQEVSMKQHCSIVATDVFDYQGIPAFELDKDQRSERDRLKNKFF